MCLADCLCHAGFECVCGSAVFEGSGSVLFAFCLHVCRVVVNGTSDHHLVFAAFKLSYYCRIRNRRSGGPSSPPLTTTATTNAPTSRTRRTPRSCPSLSTRAATLPAACGYGPAPLLHMTEALCIVSSVFDFNFSPVFFSIIRVGLSLTSFHSPGCLLSISLCCSHPPPSSSPSPIISRLQTQCARCLIQYCDTCKSENLQPYLTTLLPRLFELLRGGARGAPLSVCQPLFLLPCLLRVPE